MPNGTFEVDELRRERDCASVRLEHVRHQRIVDIGESFWCIDANRLSSQDDIRRRSTAGLGPVPVGLTNGVCGLEPFFLFGLVLVRDLDGVSLDDLL